METLIQDIRYGVRILLKQPAFTLMAVLALALGIGANSAIFSVVNSLLLRPLPLADPDKLVQIWGVNARLGRFNMPASYPDFADLRDQNQVFEQTVAYADWSFNLTGTNEPERISSAIVSPMFFSMLGIKPVAGRVFLSDEDQKGKDAVAVIGRRLWQRRFNSDPQVIGKQIELNAESYTIVGLVAQMADVPGLPDETELWLPVSHGYGFTNRRGHYLGVMARLKPDVTIEQAQTNMDSIAAGLAERYPEADMDRGVRLIGLHDQIVGKFRIALLVLFGAVVFVLLIASANVASMLLSRAASRQKEIALRAALGARRSRVIRQLLTESLLLSLIGGALGLLLALWGTDLLVAFSPSDLPRISEVTVDGRVLAFTLATSLCTGIIFGLVPALHASGPDLNEALKEGSRSATGGIARRRALSLLVVTEIALSLVLVIGAGLLVKSFHKLQSVNLGFNPENVLTMQLELSGPNFKRGAPIITFHDQLLERIRSLPGVQAASTRSYVPIAPDASFALLSFMIEGRPPDPSNRPIAYYNAVSSDFFHTMEIPVLKGRSFDEHDVRKAQNVAIINETIAHRYFSNEDPIGKRITLNDENPKEEEWATIVGVVGDTKARSLDSEPAGELYLPFAQEPEPFMSLMIRATNKPETILAGVRDEVLALDKDQPVYSVRTLDRVLSQSVATPRFRTFLLLVLAGVALILAVVGIYGVMSYGVAQRTHEIGIRVALGARSSDVLRLVVGQGLVLAISGVAIGLAVSFALTRVMMSLLFEVSTTDLLTFTIVPLVLTGVALGACFVPARRATKVDPMVALRYE
jgi:putative ABC transport system permease protein